MRRRLWWQILTLDVYYCESRGSLPLVYDGSYDTKFPSNIPDEQLSPVSGIIGREQVGATEMTISFISYEASATLYRFAALNPRNRKNAEETLATVEEKEKLVQDFCQRLHTKYVAHCDGSIPILFAASETGRIVCLRLWLLLQRPMYTLRRQTTKPAQREYILASALSWLEMVEDIEANIASRDWLWYMKGYVPWYPIAIVLAELCVQTRGWLVDRAWTTIQAAYDKWSERVADLKFGGLWRPIRKFFDQAKRARFGGGLNQSITEDSTDRSQHRMPLKESAFQASQSSDYKRLHLASVALTLGDPHQLDSLLRCAEQQSTFSPDPPGDPADVPAYSIESIDWGDWDNFVQSTLTMENQIPSTGDMMWSDIVLTTPGAGI